MNTELATAEQYEFKPLARVGDSKSMKTMLQSDRMKTALLEILPQFSDDADPEKHISRLVAQAGIAYMSNNKLGQCTQLSFFEAMMCLAETGLSLSRQSGEAYLVPFADTQKGIVNCTFMPGYRGLIKLAVQTGGVKDVYSYTVHEGDEFEVKLGTSPQIIHKPSFEVDRSNDTKITHVYAVIDTATGGQVFQVMTRAEVERIRKLSKAPNSPAWKNHWGEQARKTVIKRTLKTVPQSVSDKAVSILERAIELDNHAGGFVDVDIEEYKQADQEAKTADWNQRVQDEAEGTQNAESNN